MKKILGKILLIFFIASICAKPAFAGLKVDGSQLTGVITKYTTKIMEATEKVTQQINQIKLMDAQGYNWDSLKSLALDYYKKNGGTVNLTQMNDLVKGTKAKKLNEEKEKANAYKKSSIDLYERKKENADMNLEQTKRQLVETERKIETQEKECESLQVNYDQLEAEEAGAGDEIVVKLAECKSELDDLKSNAEELKAQKENIQETIENINETLDKFEKEEDEIQKANAQRIELLNNDSEEKNPVTEDNNKEKEWDSDNALESYQLNDAEYTTFMNNYFYDPHNLNSSQDNQDNKGLAYENYINRIMRNRRYLFINTAVHLLQVTTTTRRELPTSEETADTMFEQTAKSEGELEALIAYSNARLENAKALLLYAKLLSSKIQYLAARDLLNAELKKEIYDEDGNQKSYEGFNLEKYILTEEYVENMHKEAMKTSISEEYNKKLEKSSEMNWPKESNEKN